MNFFLEHMNDFWPGLIASLIIGLALVQVPWVRRQTDSFAPDPLSRAFVGLFIGAITFVGWTKGPVSVGKHVAQFVVAMSDGSILDESGLIATSTEEDSVEAFADLSVAIHAAASQTVANAYSEFYEVSFLVTNKNREVIYVQSTLPRTDPTQGLTNHNISAFVMRTEMNTDQTVLSRYVWYSEQPLVAPTVACVADVGAGDVFFSAITNTFPDTTSISGIDCVRYDFAVPEELRSVVFFPDTELTFGSIDKPLKIGIGISVDVGEDTYLPFTGTDTNFSGRVQIDYKGGIATACRIDGETVTNGVYEL